MSREEIVQELKDSVKTLDLKSLSFDELKDLMTKTSILNIEPPRHGCLKIITKGLVLTKYPPNGDKYLNPDFCVEIIGNKNEITSKAAEFLRRLEITPRWADDRPGTFFRSLCEKMIRFKFDTIKELISDVNHIQFSDESGMRIEFESLIHYDLTIWGFMEFEIE